MRKRLRNKLSETLPAETKSKVYNSFDVIGDIAIIKIHPSNISNAEKVAKQIITDYKTQGYIPTHRPGPTGIGKTLEDILGIIENNIDISNNRKNALNQII